jgi:hypothetical protein
VDVSVLLTCVIAWLAHESARKFSMRVKLFSEPLSGNPQQTEVVVNEFLATLTTASIRHVQTAVAAATENEKVSGRIIITIWYDDLGELKVANDVTDAEIIEISDHQSVSERSA